MRLGTCLALELAALSCAVGGTWLVATRGVTVAGDYLQSREASAATVRAYPPGPLLEPLPRADLAVGPRPPDNIFGAPDAELLAPVATSPLTRVKLNHGGTSLSLRLDFASGARAAFKPLQIHPQSDPRREIAAYRIDRLLGIGHVPPAKSAAFAITDVIAAIDPAGRPYAGSRITDEAIVRQGQLIGEVSWWIPEIKLVKLGGELIDDPEGQAQWTTYLQAGAELPVELRPMLAQIAAVIVFDVVIDNSDRWSGNNTEGSPDGALLYFMDNTLAFSTYTIGHATNLAKLYRIQVFPRGLIGALRMLTRERVEAALGGEDDLLGPLLTAAEIRAIISRRDHLLAYVDRLVAEHGDAQVLALP